MRIDPKVMTETVWSKACSFLLRFHVRTIADISKCCYCLIVTLNQTALPSDPSGPSTSHLYEISMFHVCLTSASSSSQKVTVCTFVSCHASNIRGNSALQFVETASSQTAIIDFVKRFVRMCVDSTSRVTFLFSANLWDVGNGHWWRRQDVYGVLTCVYVSLVLWLRKLPVLTVR